VLKAAIAERIAAGLTPLRVVETMAGAYLDAVRSS
jgi:hypothetical protein